MPTGTYTGRLSFNPDTLYHTDPDGNHVVTDDAGQTWRYATDADTPHNDRYHQQAKAIQPTADASLPGQEHHLEVQPGDAHFAGLTFHDDTVAHLQTSHTDAWKEQ